MAVKYECPKCGRRFTEWGAEQLGFKCPQDQYCPENADGETELTRVGANSDTPTAARKVSLKRAPKKRPATPASAPDTDELMAPDTEALDDESADEDAQEDEEEEEEAIEPPKLKLGDDDDDDDDGPVLSDALSEDSVFSEDTDDVDNLDA